MTTIDIKKLLSAGENVTVEFKESKSDLNKDVYDSVCGMLNRLGGHLLLGVKDNGDIVGIDPSCVDKIKKTLLHRLIIPIRYDLLFTPLLNSL